MISFQRSRRAFLLVALVALAIPGVALADNLCSQAASTICCGDEVSLPLSNTYKSRWEGSNPSAPYVALRYTSSGSVSYQRNIGGGLSHTFTNSVDAYRRTAFRLQTNLSTNYAMYQWALGAC